MSYALRLIEDLVSGGTVVERGENTNEYLVEVYRNHPLAQPCRLILEPDAIRSYVEAIAEDAVVVFPEVDQTEAGYRLMLVHLDEAIDTGRPPTAEVRFTNDEIVTIPVTGWVDPLDDLPPGDYRWVTARPDRPR